MYALMYKTSEVAMKRIFEYRKKAKLKQGEFAELVSARYRKKIAQSQISFYESGKHEPSIDILKAMIEVFNDNGIYCTVDEFVKTSMSQDEYIEKLKKISEKFKQDRLNLDSYYSRMQEKYTIGDVVSNGHNTIKIDLVSVSLHGSFPEPLYSGVKLTKKGIESKRGERLSFSQSSIVEQ